MQSKILAIAALLMMAVPVASAIVLPSEGPAGEAVIDGFKDAGYQLVVEDEAKEQPGSPGIKIYMMCGDADTFFFVEKTSSSIYTANWFFDTFPDSNHEGHELYYVRDVGVIHESTNAIVGSVARPGNLEFSISKTETRGAHFQYDIESGGAGRNTGWGSLHYADIREHIANPCAEAEEAIMYDSFAQATSVFWDPLSVLPESETPFKVPATVAITTRIIGDQVVATIQGAAEPDQVIDLTGYDAWLTIGQGPQTDQTTDDNGGHTGTCGRNLDVHTADALGTLSFTFENCVDKIQGQTTWAHLSIDDGQNAAIFYATSPVGAAELDYGSRFDVQHSKYGTSWQDSHGMDGQSIQVSELDPANADSGKIGISYYMQQTMMQLDDIETWMVDAYIPEEAVCGGGSLRAGMTLDLDGAGTTDTRTIYPIVDACAIKDAWQAFDFVADGREANHGKFLHEIHAELIEDHPTYRISTLRLHFDGMTAYGPVQVDNYRINEHLIAEQINEVCPLITDGCVQQGLMGIDDGHYVVIEPRNPVWTPVGSAMEYNNRFNYVFDVCAYQADGQAADFTDFRLELVAPSQDTISDLEDPDAFTAFAIGSIGNTHGLDREVPANNGDHCVVVNVPAYAKNQGLIGQTFLIDFWFMGEHGAQRGFYSEAVNTLHENGLPGEATGIDEARASGVLMLNRNTVPAMPSL